MPRGDSPDLTMHGTLARRAIGRVRTEGTEERLLLERVAAGDLAAFERLYRIYQPRLDRFLTTLLRRPQLVEEVLDDTMMVVWQTAANFRGTSKLSTWIFAIAYRKAMKARVRWPDPVEDDKSDVRVSEEPTPEQRIRHLKLHDAIVAAMKGLSAEHRAVVDLTYFHGLGYREIAEIVSCPVDTVKTRMFHARRRLKAAFAGSLDDWL
ncbi:MAG TPA: sigma-70 family RNA polymerase sigma factor [Sphingomicrobium sp.]|nr:sigma-70 family RNA polymerase sigma factor [Sphingomicrobium sp.]